MLNGTNVESGCTEPIAMSAMRAVVETSCPHRRVPKATVEQRNVLYVLLDRRIAKVDANFVGIHDVLAGKAIRRAGREENQPRLLRIRAVAGRPKDSNVISPRLIGNEDSCSRAGF